MFWFLLIAMVAVVAAVTLAVVGGGDEGGLGEAAPDRLYEPLPADRPASRADVEAVRLPVGVRGYRMNDVDDVLDRLGAELAERDARIAELEAALAGEHAAAMGPPGLIKDAPEDGSGDRAGTRTGDRPAAPAGEEPLASGGEDDGKSAS
ncbi:cell division protein DivIVA [Streptomyces sp. CB02923]|uniref:DivIVA domain-containing protein n=1 Tax=Streptomyces sp. CB02923 TaxID=1718985 RepID=UPI00093BF061|nr:DivIVA domain-containing protein [Streptomyces sp. CB02923]OKI10275.1 cell division protein DivIVA [Streptomyces sp. CB02923]